MIPALVSKHVEDFVQKEAAFASKSPFTRRLPPVQVWADTKKIGKVRG